MANSLLGPKSRAKIVAGDDLRLKWREKLDFEVAESCRRMVGNF